MKYASTVGFVELGYDPFGMTLVGRAWSSGSEYRYGFNGQEQDDEVYGNGNLNTAEFWGYDARLGRRWNLDPICQTSLSPYATMDNNPIGKNDINGDRADEPRGKARKSIILETVVIQGEKSGFFERISKGLTIAVVSIEYGVNAWLSNNGLGNRKNPDNISDSELRSAAKYGQSGGDYASIVTGTVELALGYVSAVVGDRYAVVTFGGSAVVGNTLGVVATVHGVTVIKNAHDNIVNANKTNLKVHTGGGGEKIKSVNQLNQEIYKGKAPKTIKRFDTGKVYKEQDNVHFSDGSALNRDGSWKHGEKKLTNSEKEYLIKSGWTLPK